MRILLLLLSISSSVFGCGLHLPEPFARHSRAIIGGAKVTTPDKWPWQVLLLFNVHDFKESGGVCGGTIIGEQWVLTAAHCLENKNVSRMIVLAGTNSLQNAVQDTSRKVIDAIIHPEYDENMVYNDIAILKLDIPLVFNYTVASICLPNPSQSIQDDWRAVVTGFGKANVDVNGTEEVFLDMQMREAIVPIIPPEVCKERWSHVVPGMEALTLHRWNFRSVICASSLAHGTHQGDSGGPLMMKASNGRWFEIGISSFMHCETKDCPNPSDGIRGDLFPKVFTDVRKYCDWIKDTTGGEVSCQDEEVTLEDVEISA